jgi:4-hydroxybenzoate polyprenyltransferase
VLASDGAVNLTGRRKLRALEERFGTGGFDYVANAAVDLPIWARAKSAIVVNAGPGLVRRAAKVSEVSAVFRSEVKLRKALPRAIRVHQWVKNLLIFVPLVTSLQLFNGALLAQAGLGFAAFCLCASSVYVLNDLLDLGADRRHRTKRTRPFASGDLSIKFGVGLTAALLLASASVALLLPWTFRLILALYYVATQSYSLYFKRKLLLDVHFLGGLYTLRLLAGNTATGVVWSPWLLAFSMFLFLSLALVKRFAELRSLRKENRRSVKGRSYHAADVQAIASLGTGSGFLCVLVLALYLNSHQVGILYPTPAILWLLCPLIMYWISRVWVIAYRGKMDGDPVLFALKDRVSCVTGLCAALVIGAASLAWPI